MRITGAHSIIYSRDPEADRAFLRDVLGFPHVDVGDGWLIFGLPPAEVAVHPSEENDRHEFYLMCDDLEAVVAEMEKHVRGVRAGSGRRLGPSGSDHAAGRRRALGLPAAACAAGAGKRRLMLSAS